MIPKKEIPIFFTIDDSYAPYISVAIKSITENASKEKKYKIIVLYQELSKENIERISSLTNENFEIKFVYMKDGLESITDRVENRLRCDYFTLTIYFRLFIPDMFPEYDKGIYIDSDIVVPGDISELYNMELGDNLIGACADKSVVDVPELAKYKEKNLYLIQSLFIIIFSKNLGAMTIFNMQIIFGNMQRKQIIMSRLLNSKIITQMNKKNQIKNA